jgi:hypothetical protein
MPLPLHSAAIPLATAPTLRRFQPRDRAFARREAIRLDPHLLHHLHEEIGQWRVLFF